MEMWKPLQPTRLEQRGFRGMRDVLIPGDAQADMPMVIHNMIPLDPEHGGPLATRPPWQKLGTVAVGAACQLAYNYRTLAGANRFIIIIDGAIYYWNVSAWAVYITAGQLSGASVTLSTTNSRIFATTIGGKLVISDGTNTPFMYDDTTVTKLTACPVLYGQPTVYYAKLVGIKAADRSTFVWSEENDPTIGYESGGFNNAWQLGQTSSAPLQLMVGTNQGLYYWRPYSMGVIRGAVTTDFVNDGVHDGVSSSVGTSTASYELVDETLYWVSTDGRPYCLTIGGDITPLWGQMARKFDHTRLGDAVYSASGNSYGDGYQLDVELVKVGAIRVAYHPGLDLVVFGYPLSTGWSSQGDSGTRYGSGSRIAYLVCFSHRLKSLQAYWTFPRGDLDGASCFATATRTISGPQTEVGLFLYSHGSTTNFAYFMSSQYTYNLDDDIPPGSQVPKAPPQFVIGPPQGMSDDVTVAFDRLDVSVGARPMTTAPSSGTPYQAQIGAALHTSNHQVSDELSSPIYSGDAALFPAGGTDQVQTAGNIRITQNSFGFAEEGRWARALLRIVPSVDRGGAYVTLLRGWTLTAMARTRAPATNIAPP